MAEKDRLEKFHRGLEELHISLKSEQMEQFLLYYRMLTEWNRRMNLTTITEFDEVVEKHFLDSLCLVKAVPNLLDQRVLDLGTGAGFPGIPLKIAFPGLNLTLIDSVGKKLKFLDAVIKETGLFGVEIVHGRAEDLAHEEKFREQFDLCVSRAVADLTVLSEYGLPFVKTGGSFVAYKSADADVECAQANRAVSLMGGETEEILKYELPGTNVERSLVLIKKKKGTPAAYPRKAGTPSRDPLKQIFE